MGEPLPLQEPEVDVRFRGARTNMEGDARAALRMARRLRQPRGALGVADQQDLTGERWEA